MCKQPRHFLLYFWITLIHQRRNCWWNEPIKRTSDLLWVTKTRNTPHILCYNCKEMLCDWTIGKHKGLPFGIPMTWQESKDYTIDCYFCLVNTKGIGKKNKHKITYSSIPSIIRLTLLSNELPVPVFTELSKEESINDDVTQDWWCNSRNNDWFPWSFFYFIKVINSSAV